MADRDIEVVIRAADEFSATLNKAKTEFGSTASEIAKGSEKFETSWDKSLQFLRSRIALTIASIYMMKKAWDFAFEAATSTENKEVLKFMNDTKDTIELIKLKLGELAIVIGAAFINVFAGIGSAINFVLGKITGAVAIVAGAVGLGGISAAFKEISENSLEASKLGQQYAESAKKVGAAVRQELFTIKEQKKEATAAEKEAIRIYETAEDKIRNLVFETVKLGATEEQLIAIEQAKFIATGASIDQIERYTTALQQNMEGQQQAATAKEAARLNEMAILPETAAAKGAQTELEVKSAGGDLWAKHQLEIQMIEEKNAIILQSAIAAGLAQTEIERIESENRIRIANQEKDLKLSLSSQTFGNMASIAQAWYEASGKQSKEAFAVYKAFAIAQTTIDTFRGAVAAYQAMAGIPIVGPALGAVAAAAVIAFGIMKVNQIRAMEPGQGTVAASGGATIPTTSSGMTAAATGSMPTRLTEQQVRPSQDISINVYALDPSSVNWDRLAENNIIPAINNAGNRNIKMNVNVVAS